MELTTAADILRFASRMAQTDLVYEAIECPTTMDRLNKAYELGYLTGSPEGITTLTAKGTEYLASH